MSTKFVQLISCSAFLSLSCASFAIPISAKQAQTGNNVMDKIQAKYRHLHSIQATILISIPAKNTSVKVQFEYSFPYNYHVVVKYPSGNEVTFISNRENGYLIDSMNPYIYSEVSLAKNGKQKANMVLAGIIHGYTPILLSGNFLMPNSNTSTSTYTLTKDIFAPQMKDLVMTSRLKETYLRNEQYDAQTDHNVMKSSFEFHFTYNPMTSLISDLTSYFCFGNKKYIECNEKVISTRLNPTFKDTVFQFHPTKKDTKVQTIPGLDSLSNQISRVQNSDSK